MSSFQTFATGPVSRFAAHFRNVGGVWVFQHIPKTAGSSLTRELAGTFAPYRNIFLRPPLDPNVPPGDALLAEVDRFLEENETRRYASASGHLRERHLNRIRQGIPSMRLFTVLRDPAERLVSDYRYAKTPRHPPHEAFARRFPTIEAYLDEPNEQNKMWQFVRSGRRACDAEGLADVFGRYAFIGLVADLPLHFQFLSGLTTCPRRPVAHVNVTTEQSDNAVDLSPALRRRIEALNADDCTLYAAVRDVLARKAPEMREFVAERRAYFLGAPD